MSAMVFCRGCGKEIHETAPTCPHCGAVQNSLYRPAHGIAALSGDDGRPGFGPRLVAAVLDGLIVVAGAFVAGLVLGVLMAIQDAGETELELAGNLLGLGLGWLYAALFESSHLQATPGKMALGIQVTDLNGERVSFGRATGRHFGKWVSALTLGIGYLMCLFTARKQCLHDLMAGCLMQRKA